MQVLAFLLSSLSLAAAKPLAPRTSAIQNGITQDATFSIPDAQLSALPLICPNGVQNAPRKNILFIHGTGGRGDESWAGLMLPAFHTQGCAAMSFQRRQLLKVIGRYNGCYANLPNRTLGDAQLTSEYVVSLIDRMYSATGNNVIHLVGHSQGNINIQWALSFWPSRRTKIAAFVSLAGVFQGTSEGPFLSAVQEIFEHGVSPSVLQQSILLGQQSAYLRALNKHGNEALVPTTSIYTLADDIIQIEPMSSTLASGSNFAMLGVQQACPLQFPDHFSLLANPPAFYLALDALNHGGLVSLSRTLAAQRVAAARIAFREALAVGGEGAGTQGGPLSQRAQLEPPLQPYAAHQP
jgi:pimeloyl-ACP methyl ester carboxylesterase